MRANVGAPAPSCGANTEDTELDNSDYMEALQLSADGCSQDVANVGDVELLSAGISNLKVQPINEEHSAKPEISICISSTTEENVSGDDDAASCITISDSSEDEQEPLPPDSMAVSEREIVANPGQEDIPQPMLTTEKVQRIEAFLRDVSIERREMEWNGPLTPPPLFQPAAIPSSRCGHRIHVAHRRGLAATHYQADLQQHTTGEQRYAGEYHLLSRCHSIG